MNRIVSVVLPKGLEVAADFYSLCAVHSSVHSVLNLGLRSFLKVRFRRLLRLKVLLTFKRAQIRTGPVLARPVPIL